MADGSRPRFSSLSDYVKHRLDTEPRLTHEKIAEDLGITPSALSTYLNGRRTPKNETALQIAERASVELASLLRKAS